MTDSEFKFSQWLKIPLVLKARNWAFAPWDVYSYLVLPNPHDVAKDDAK